MSNKPDVRRTQKQRPWVIDVYAAWEKAVGDIRKAKGSITDFSSWFHRRTVPEAQRSRMVDTRKGKMNVATIYDVARWSTTVRGGSQAGFDFKFEEESFNVDDAHAPCQSGYCE